MTSLFLKRTAAFVLSLSAVFLSSNSRAALIFSDTVPLSASGGGGYVVATNLSGQSATSTTGFASTWGGANSANVQPNSSNVAVAGVDGNDPLSGSMRLNSSVGNFRAGSRSFSGSTVSGASTLWFGSTYQVTTTGGLAAGSGGLIGVLSGTLANSQSNGATPTPGSVPFWGFAGEVGPPAVAANSVTRSGFMIGAKSGFLTVDYQTAAGGTQSVGELTSSAPANQLAFGTNYFLVAKLDINVSGTANDTLSVWLLTSAPTSDTLLGAANLTVSGVDILTDSGNLNTLVMESGSYSSAAYLFDAMRLGTSYTDLITAVPEPSSLGLMILGSLGLIAYRRGRKLAV